MSRASRATKICTSCHVSVIRRERSADAMLQCSLISKELASPRRGVSALRPRITVCCAASQLRGCNPAKSHLPAITPSKMDGSSSFCITITSKLDSYFCISERGSTIGTEFRAGTAAFLTLSYLLLVNPQVMSAAGLDHGDALIATALSSAVASFVVGVGGNVPYGLAPGLGLSAYLSYGLIQSGMADLPEALTACLASGILLLVCALSGLTDLIIRIVPRSIKLAIVVGMGILIAMIGMVSGELPCCLSCTSTSAYLCIYIKCILINTPV